MSIELTNEQAEALENGETPPRVIHPRTREVFVLLKASLYEKLQQAHVEEIDPSLYEFEDIDRPS